MYTHFFFAVVLKFVAKMLTFYCDSPINYSWKNKIQKGLNSS